MEITTENQLENAVEAAKIDLENPNYYGTCANQDGSANVEVPARPLHLFTASAGSGKTWRLAFEYICLLLKDAYLPSENKKNESIPDNYRHILAITFTNKATSEMKDRILANFEMLLNDNSADERAKKERDTYLLQLSARLSISPQTVIGRAKLVYSNLLHDYSHFHIQTIDSFFQSVLRNLAQELGIGSYWEVELNSDEVLKEAAHRLLNKVRDDKNLLAWVSKYVQEKLDDNRNWNIEGELVSFGSNLFSEALVTNDEMGDFITDDPENPTLRKRISLIKAAVAESRRMVLADIKSTAKRAVDYCSAHDMPVDHFATKGQARNFIYNYFADLSNDVERKWSPSLTNFIKAETPDEMDKIAFLKPHQGKHLADVAELQNLMKQIKDDNYRIVVFNQVLKNINQIGLLSDIKNEVAALQEEQNIFMLAYAQPLLHKFISNEDAPFVFERIGESLHYMMIDEFQDTSKVQYQNFRPLIQNCCSSYKGSLIVGDAKQAIYRFRNGDWTLIESLRKQAEGKTEPNVDLVMPVDIQAHNMQFNYRSAPNVVDFNNAVFRAEFTEESDPSYPLPFKKSIVSLLDAANAGHVEYLKQVYSTARQFAKKYDGGERKGYVKVKFHQTADSDSNPDEDENATPWTLNALLAEITDAHEKGVAYGDMTILARFNKDIPKIADFLTENGLSVVSDLAFLLRASNKVRLIIDALRYVDAYVSKTSSHPKDELYKKQLSCDYLRFLNSTKAESYDFNGSVDNLELWCQMLRGELNLEGKVVSDLMGQNAGETDVLPSLPVYDMAEEIYHLFFPSLPTDEYVQAFFDYLRDFVAHRVVTVRDVLNYWDDKLSGISIPAGPKNSGDIKIMSIHKSKGLESHTIFLANCSWKATTDRRSSFWCSGINKLGDGMEKFEIPMLPIDFSSDLEGTTFDGEYWEEMAQLHAENVNLFYVALTRAEQNLIVIDEYSIPKKESKDDSKFLNAKMGRLLYELFDNDDLQKDDVFTLDDDSEMCYVLGHTAPSKTEEAKDKGVVPEIVSKQDTFPIRGRFRQSSEANTFILNKAITTSTSADFGIQMHSLLAFITCIYDCNNPQPEIHKAVERLVLEGVVSVESSAEFENDAIHYFKTLLEKGNYLQEWFSPKLKVYNEEGIILYNAWTNKLEEKRPDRMVYNAKNDTFTIIDYKTGHFSDALFKKHSEQVQTYMKLAKQLSPNSGVCGYVWYLTENKVKLVD